MAKASNSEVRSFGKGTNLVFHTNIICGVVDISLWAKS